MLNCNVAFANCADRIGEARTVSVRELADMVGFIFGMGRLRRPCDGRCSGDCAAVSGLIPRRFPRIESKLSKGAVKLTKPVFQEKLGIFARRFPKGDRKALWWGDGAKPHILKMLSFLILEISGLSLTAPSFLRKIARFYAPAFLM